MQRLRALRQIGATDNMILALACVAQFMVVLDVSIVNVALPQIGRELHFSSTGLQWVVNAYVLTFAGFLLLGGRAADLFGRKRVFLAGLAVFSLASLAGGLAQTAAQLTIARAVQGLGGAILSPATLTIITTTFTDGRSRTRAIGIWSSVAGAGGATGAVFGGILTGYLNWRWVLFVNVPIGAAAIALSAVILTEARRPSSGKLDIAGAVTATGGLALLVYAIVSTDTHPWGSTRTIGLLAGAAALLAVFVFIEARVASDPLMPLSVFKSRSLTAANLTMLLLGACFFSMWYFLTLYLQDVHGYGPLKAGLLFLPMGLAIVAGAQASIRLIERFGSQRVLMGGLLLVVGGFLWLAHITASSTYLAGVFPGALCTSFGVGLSFTPLAQTATSGVPMQLAGLASGLLNTSRQVGGSIGLAALATVAIARTHAVAHSLSVKQAFTSGYDRAFLTAAVVSLVALAVTFAIPRPTNIRPAGEAVTELQPTPATAD
ncbi:MAG TPA: MFS transporter [Acidimicrobiales bacterium]|nr:MFS transporter [Acidimicrobiales bacterium]